MALSVKYLPCKHEGLSSVPRTKCGKREAMLQSARAQIHTDESMKKKLDGT